MGFILDIGCGPNKQPGTIGIDRRLLPGIDLLCDVERSLPFHDGSVTSVYSIHSIEHIRDLMSFMQELYRICVPGAKVYVRTPYYMSRNAFVDPTHVRFMTEKTFEYFSFPNCYGLMGHFKVVSIQYNMRKSFKWLPQFVQRPLRRHLWNACDELAVTLEAVKPCGA